MRAGLWVQLSGGWMARGLPGLRRWNGAEIKRPAGYAGGVAGEALRRAVLGDGP